MQKIENPWEQEFMLMADQLDNSSRILSYDEALSY